MLPAVIRNFGNPVYHFRSLTRIDRSGAKLNARVTGGAIKRVTVTASIAILVTFVAGANRIVWLTLIILMTDEARRWL